MSDAQLFTIALSAVSIMLTVLLGILINGAKMREINSNLDALRARMDSRFDEMLYRWSAELKNRG